MSEQLVNVHRAALQHEASTVPASQPVILRHAFPYCIPNHNCYIDCITAVHMELEGEGADVRFIVTVEDVSGKWSSIRNVRFYSTTLPPGHFRY